MPLLPNAAMICWNPLLVPVLVARPFGGRGIGDWKRPQAAGQRLEGVLCEAHLPLEGGILFPFPDRCAHEELCCE